MRYFSLALLVTLALTMSPAFATQPPQPLGCLIEANEIAELGSSVTGIVESVTVERGDTVIQGQVLATLRDTVERAQLGVSSTRAQIEADIRGAKAALNLAKDRHKRAKGLQQRGFLSEQAVVQSRTELTVAREKLQQAEALQEVTQREVALAEARLGERVIRSPFDGVVTDRYLSVGERIEERPVLRVAKIHPLRVEVVMPNMAYGSIQPGTSLDIIPNIPGVGRQVARVTRVDKVLDAASNTFRARLELPNPDHALPAGVRCKAEFPLLTTPAPEATRPANGSPASLTQTTPPTPNTTAHVTHISLPSAAADGNDPMPALRIDSSLLTIPRARPSTPRM